MKSLVKPAFLALLLISSQAGTLTNVSGAQSGTWGLIVKWESMTF